VIVIPSLSHEYEPWQWTTYAPTWVDYAILAGSFGWFSMWFLLFIKQLPVVAISEVKEIIPPRMRHPQSSLHQGTEHGGMANPQMAGGHHTTGGTH
jgi:molybdopterin-containing oxidoreductase family membrane subunit